MSLPSGLRDRQVRRNKIAAAGRELEQRARDRRAREQERRREVAAEEGRSYEPCEAAPGAQPREADQLSFTDPEWHIMKSSDGAFVRANARSWCR
jgi:hypothetical protein